MYLARDLLDNQLLDRNNLKIGKVDGLVMVMRDGEPPRIGYIEAGAITLARRISRRLEKWVAGLAYRLGGERHRSPYRIPWSKVISIDIDVKVDIDADETPVRDWQHWLGRKVFRRIPGV